MTWTRPTQQNGKLVNAKAFNDTIPIVEIIYVGWKFGQNLNMSGKNETGSLNQ